MTIAKGTPSTITVHVPLRFAARGGRKVIIGQVPHVSHGARHALFDDALVKAIARAHRWRALIEDDTYSSITELARDKGINQSYACRLLQARLARETPAHELGRATGGGAK
jgi:hypothetical protein